MRAVADRVVIERVRKAIEKAGGLRALATQLGLSPSYLSDVQHGKRACTGALAAHVGVERVTFYREA